jgi:hypothetical protein
VDEENFFSGKDAVDFAGLFRGAKSQPAEMKSLRICDNFSNVVTFLQKSVAKKKQL